ncbi:MAG: hypothetical protein A4S14_11695 [Proteobacteria bacterium SG_bin9]|nr:MAG: hypothetical protein A4S14_11695 [Proteobacteria bacterium SG_bin9]
MSDHLTEAPSEIESAKGGMPWYVKAGFIVFFALAMLFGAAMLSVIDDNCRLARRVWTPFAVFMGACVAAPAFFLFLDQFVLPFMPNARPRVRLTMIFLLFVCLLSYGFSAYAAVRTEQWLGSKTEPYGPAFCKVFRTIQGPPMTLNDLNR